MRRLLTDRHQRRYFRILQIRKADHALIHLYPQSGGRPDRDNLGTAVGRLLRTVA